MKPDYEVEIDNLTHEQMCRLYRFSEIGHKYFTNTPELEYFMKRYYFLGGMTIEISKRIGWNK